ncbi:MAG: hypothetical protein ACLUAR_20060 [Pilosibacter sp.]
MANRRMFSLAVVDTDRFMDMPASSQCLYFHLGMRADDDGFVSSPRKITKLVNCSSDDLKILIARGYVLLLGEGLVVITHWKQNNYLRSDRHTPTVYGEELKGLTIINGKYIRSTDGIPVVDRMDTQYSIDEDSKDKDSKDKDSKEQVNSCNDAEEVSSDLKKLVSDRNSSVPSCTGIKMILKDKSFYDVPVDKLEIWKSAYPAVAVESELKKMVAWCESNPERRKTRRGITSFINGWLNRAQDQGNDYIKRTQTAKEDEDDENRRPASDFYKQFMPGAGDGDGH